MNLLDRILKHREEQGYQYGSLWPTRYKVDSKGNPVRGSLEFDPGAGVLGSTVRAAHELTTVPGEVASGKRPLTGDLGPRLAGDMFALGTPGGLTSPSGAFGIFGSKGARGFSDFSLNEARQMEEKGHNPTEVFQTTGMFKGGDGKWRFEIPDSQARVNKAALVPSQTGNGKYYVPGNVGLNLGEVLHHPELYRNYPNMASIPVKAVSSTGALKYSGQYSPAEDRMAILGAKEPELLKTLLHETQHAIDTREGLQAGANTDMYIPLAIRHMQSELPGEHKALLEKMDKDRGAYPFIYLMMHKQDKQIPLTADQQDEMRQYAHEPWMSDFLDLYGKHKAVNAAQQAAEDAYKRTGGEVMARNVENRLAGWQNNGSNGTALYVQPADMGEKSFIHPIPKTAMPSDMGLIPPKLTEDVPRFEQLWNPTVK